MARGATWDVGLEEQVGEARYIAEAPEAAVLELVERDAAARWWLARPIRWENSGGTWSRWRATWRAARRWRRAWAMA